MRSVMTDVAKMRLKPRLLPSPKNRLFGQIGIVLAAPLGSIDSMELCRQMLPLKPLIGLLCR
jgi:hypothetical protein